MLHLKAKGLVATNLTKVLREFRKNNKDYKVAVITVNTKVTVGVYWGNTGDKFDEKGKFSIQDTLKLQPGDKLLATVKNSSNLNTKKNAIYVYDENKGAWGRIPGGYAKKLIESSDIRASLLESIVDNKKDSRQKELDDLQKQTNDTNDKIRKICDEFASKNSTSNFKLKVYRTVNIIGEYDGDDELPRMKISMVGDHIWKYNEPIAVNDVRLYLEVSSFKMGDDAMFKESFEKLNKVLKEAGNIVESWKKDTAPQVAKLLTELQTIRNKMFDLNKANK